MKEIVIRPTIFVIFFSASISGYAKDWSVYSSENFTLYSDLSERRATNLIRDFESYRNLVFEVFEFMELEPKPRANNLHIYAFSSRRDYRKNGLEGSPLFIAGISGPKMVLARPERSISFGEGQYYGFVRYLIREFAETSYPRWLESGMETLLRATTFENGTATISTLYYFGGTTLTHLQRPNTVSALSIISDNSLTIEDLFEPNLENDSEEYWQDFFRYAFGFTHFLNFSALRGDQELNQNRKEFLLRLNQGEDSIDAFSASFDASLDELDSQMKEYLDQRNVTVLSVEMAEYVGEIKKATLSPGEEVALLADLAYSAGQEEIALGFLEEVNSDNPDHAEALSLAAVLEQHRGNLEIAEQYANQALFLAPNNSEVLKNLSHWQRDNFNGASEVVTDNPEENLAASLEFAKQAVNADPTNIDAHRFLWRDQVDAGNTADALQTMIEAYELYPSNILLNYEIGELYYVLDKYDLAKPYLLRARSWTPSIQMIREIDSMLAAVPRN